MPITSQATRTLKGAGTPLRGARALNVTCQLDCLLLFSRQHFFVCFVICCAKLIMLFCMWQLRWACQSMPDQSRSASHRQTILLSATPMGGGIAYDVSLGFGRVCGKLRVRKNLLSRTTKTIRSKLVIRLLAEGWFRRQYCFALHRRASVF